MWIADYISYKGKTTFIAAYRGSELVWKKQGSIPECGEPMRVIFDVTSNIRTYTKRDYKMVFDKTEQQWYILNDNNDYEKYGIIEEINSFDEGNAEWDYTTDQWTTSSTVVYNGKAYTRYCNKDISGNGSAISTITISGYKTFVLYVCTSGESNYDYMCVSNLDKQVSKQSTTNDDIKWSGYGKYVESSGTENINNYTRLEFNTDGGTHTIQVGYFKDGSVDSYDDSGYFVVINEENVSAGITTYNGKLVHYLPTYHEYEWNGTEWIDLGSTACSNVYTYKFLNWDGTVLQEGYVLEGETPEYTGETPTRPEDDNYTYEFAYWNPEPEPLYEDMTFTAVYNEIAYDNDDITLPYVTFKAEEAGSTLGLSKLSTVQTLEYSTDKSTWNTFDTSTNVALSNVGDEVYVRGKLTDNLNSADNYTQFTMTGKIAAYGNCNALWDYEDLLVLLKPYCGYALFAYCSSLTKAPKLPAMQLRDNCYAYMFTDCTSLIEAPELSATNIYSSGDYGCYQYMFSGCTSLTKAPSVLPINSIPQHMYNSMFAYCSSLTKAPELPATTLENGCYAWMFYNCTSLVNAPELPATELALDCYKSMFEGCESLVTTPMLPAITLADNCYVNMFKGCKLVTELICLAVNLFNYQNVAGWLSGVSSTGTFYKNTEEANLNILPQTEFGIPSSWTVLDYTA